MASNLPYTLQDLQDRINTLYNNDTDTPEAESDDWNLILNLINMSIGKWEGQDVLWDELWTSYTHGATISASTASYSLSSLTNLRKPGGFLKLTLNGSDDYIELISPEEYQTYGGEARVAFITGNNSAGWTLTLGWTPVAGDGTTGATMSFPYYKFATRFNSASAVSDKPELADPNYIVYDVAAAKSLMESKNNQFSVYSTEAANCLDRMRTMNEVTAPYQNGFMEDIDFINNGASIGE